MPITAAVGTVGTAAVKTTADFESAMSKVSAISGVTGDDLKELSDKAREMGAKTKFSASEAADAFQFMSMAGWKKDEMMGGMVNHPNRRLCAICCREAIIFPQTDVCIIN